MNDLIRQIDFYAGFPEPFPKITSRRIMTSDRGARKQGRDGEREGRRDGEGERVETVAYWGTGS